MRTARWIPLICICVGARCLSQAPETRPAPKIVCERPRTDIGEICCGDEIEWAWEIANAGNADLEIGNVHGPKGGHARAGKTTLMPGERTVVHLRCRAPGAASPAFAAWAGPFAKVVTLTSNDPASPHFSLRIEGHVVLLLEPSVREVDFGSLPKATSGATRAFDLVSWRGDFITDIATDNPLVSATWERVHPVGEKMRCRVTVRLADAIPFTDLWATIKLDTSAKHQRTIEVPVRVRIAPDVRVAPRTFNFGTVGQGDRSATKTIEIEKAGKDALAIYSVSVDPPGPFTTRIEEVLPGRRYRLIVGISPDAADRYVRGVVTIKTNCPGETEVPLYCYALIR